MLNGPLTIDRGDGMAPIQYDRIEVIEASHPDDDRFIIHGRAISQLGCWYAIAAYTNHDVADAIQTDILQGGTWYQFGRSFSRHPH